MIFPSSTGSRIAPISAISGAALTSDVPAMTLLGRTRWVGADPIETPLHIEGSILIDAGRVPAA
jgi:hypothetical protein